MMCTASWLLENNGYQLFFNRDEKIGRTQAIPPRQFVAADGTIFVMPVDPQGQGSWIAANEYGLTICLLNFYQGETPHGPLISRGQLLKKFAASTSAKTIITTLQTFSLHKFAPFTFVIFDGSLNQHREYVRAVQWDGNNLTDSLPLPPLISSAAKADEVRDYRRQLFQQHQNSGDSLQSLLAFHRSHNQEEGYLSPCMHRADAHTVSFTHIRVTEEEINIDYQPGAPCDGRAFHHTTMGRKAMCQFGS